MGLNCVGWFCHNKMGSNEVRFNMRYQLVAVLNRMRHVGCYPKGHTKRISTTDNTKIIRRQRNRDSPCRRSWTNSCISCTWGNRCCGGLRGDGWPDLGPRLAEQPSLPVVVRFESHQNRSVAAAHGIRQLSTFPISLSAIVPSRLWLQHGKRSWRIMNVKIWLLSATGRGGHSNDLRCSRSCEKLVVCPRIFTRYRCATFISTKDPTTSRAFWANHVYKRKTTQSLPTAYVCQAWPGEISNFDQLSCPHNLRYDRI